MAAKKFYAVRKGKKTGIFHTWDECKAVVAGFSGAEYRGFATLQEAKEYIGTENKITPATDSVKEEETLVAYVDGSYDDSIKKYAFGCVFLLPDGKIYTEYGNGDNPQSLQHRNVTGEMLGAMYAVKTAMRNEYRKLEICFDYEGIEKWVNGAWRSKTELTEKYARSMRGWMQDIEIVFTKVQAHSNVKYNELADQMAKKGLTHGNGIPKVRKLEEMESYGTDSVE